MQCTSDSLMSTADNNYQLSDILTCGLKLKCYHSVLGVWGKSTLLQNEDGTPLFCHEQGEKYSNCENDA